MGTRQPRQPTQRVGICLVCARHGDEATGAKFYGELMLCGECRENGWGLALFGERCPPNQSQRQKTT